MLRFSSEVLFEKLIDWHSLWFRRNPFSVHSQSLFRWSKADTHAGRTKKSHLVELPEPNQKGWWRPSALQPHYPGQHSVPRLPLAVWVGAAGAHQTQSTPAVNSWDHIQHAQQFLPHRQVLENHNQPLPYPQTALGQSLKVANQNISGMPRHAVVLHTLTARQILQQKTLNQVPLDSCPLICDPLPLCCTALACLLEVEWQSGREAGWDECAYSPCKVPRSSPLPMCPKHSCYTL